MAKVKLEIESNHSQVVDGWEQIKNKTLEANQANSAFGQTTKKTFTEAVNNSGKLTERIKKGNDEIKTAVQRYNEANGVIGKLVEKEKQLTEARNKSTNINLIKQYNKLIDETQAKLKSLTSTQKEVAKTNPFKGMLDVLGGNILFSLLQKAKDAFSSMIVNNVRLDKSIKNLSAITGASGKDLEFYAEQAQKMGKSIEGGAVAAVEAFKLIGSAKPELLKNKEALVEVTKAAVTLAQASGLTLPQAAENLGNALNAFGAEASDATKFINVMAASAQLGAKEIPFITEALSKFGGVAKQANVSIEESAAAIEILGAKIPEASIVGTNLRGVLIKLQILAAENGRQFKGLGAELDILAPKVKDVTFLKAKFGDENLLAIQTLIAEREQLVKLTDAVEGTNSAIEQAATNTDTIAQKSLEASNAYDMFLTSLGKTGLVVNTTKGFLDIFTSTLNDLTDLFSGDFFKADNTAMRNIKDFNKLFTDGKIGAEDYIRYITANMKNLSQTNLASFITKKDGSSSSGGTADEVKEVIGLIDQLQKDIEQLTEKRKNSTSIAEIFGLNDEIVKKQEELQKLIGKSAKDLKAAREEFDRAILDLNKRANAASLNSLTGEVRIEAEKKFQLEEVDLLQKHFEKLGKIVDSKFKLSLDQQASFNTLRLEAERKAADDLIKLEVEKQAAIDDQQKRANEQSLTGLNQNQAGAENAVNSVNRPAGLSISQFEEIKQRQLLDIQEKYAIAKLNLKLKFLHEEEKAEAAAIEKQIRLLESKSDEESQFKKAKLQKDLQLLDTQYKLEGQQIINESQSILNDIKAKRDQLANKPFSLREFFGLTEKDAANLKTGFQELSALLTNVLSVAINAKDREIQASDDKIANYDSEIESLRGKLDNEEVLLERGKANNIARIQAEIQAKEKQKEREAEIQKKALEQKKKLQKEQLLIDSITQASNLFIASSEILANTAKDPVSLAIALGAIGFMIGGFAYSKTQALKAIEEGNPYAEGVIDLKGPGTETSDEIPARLSRGESVMTAKETKKNKKGLLAIRNDDDELFKEYVLDQLKERGIRIDDDLPETLAVKKEIVKQNEINAYLKADNSKLEAEVKEMKEILNQILDENKNKIYQDQNGSQVFQKGSHRKIVKKF